MAENRKLGNNRLDTTDKGQAYFDGPFGINKGELPVVDLGWEGKALTVNEDGVTSLTTTVKNALTASTLEGGPIRIDPGEDPNPTGTLYPSSTFLFQSSSNTLLGYDLYFRQNGNIVKWKWFEGLLESGLLYGGVVTFSGSYVYVSPGSGILVDHNAVTGSEIGPLVDYVTWGPITQSITNIATQQLTYIYIDDTGALQQQSTAFTSQQYHSSIPLGAVAHFNYNSIGSFGGSVQTSYDQTSQILTFVDAFGPLKISGYGITGQASSLRISVGSGVSFIHGGFYDTDPQFPSEIPTTSQLTASIVYVHRSGSGVKFDSNNNNYFTSLRPGFYDPGTGNTASLSNNNWTIQRAYSEPKTGIVYVYYGQNVYTTYDQAVANVSSDSFTEGDTFDYTTFLGFLILKSNTTDITNTSDNKIITAGLFRGGAGGAGGGSAVSSLDDLSDVSILSPTNGQALVYNSGTSLWENGTPLTSSYALTASFLPVGTYQITSSWAINALTASFIAPTGTNAFVQGGNSFGTTATLGTNDANSLVLETNNTTRLFISSSGNIGIGTATPANTLEVNGGITATSLTASGAIINGNVTITGTASIAFLNVTYESASVIYSTGSNQFGDASDDTQTLYGSVVIPTGSLTVTGSTNITGSLNVTSGITGSLLGTSSWAINALTASNIFPAITNNTDNKILTATGGGIINGESNLTFDGSVLTVSGNILTTGAITSSGVISSSAGLFSTTLLTGNITASNISASSGVTGSLFGTSSWAVSASNSINAQTASNIFPAITNNTSTYVLTATGDGTINGNSNLTFDGNDLILGNGDIKLPVNGYIFGGDTEILNGNHVLYPANPPAQPNDVLAGTSSFLASSTQIQLRSTSEPNVIGGFNSGSIFFKTPSGSGMTYTNEGRLGIGVSNPTNTLQIQGNVSASSYTGSLFGTSSWAVSASQALTASFIAPTGNAFVQGGNSFGTTALLGTNDSQSLQFETSGSVRVTISSSGNVGIGTATPTTTLNVSGTTLLQGGQTTVRGSGATSATTALRVENSAAAARLTILDDGTSAFNTSHLYISSSGNIGIGITTPTARLQIAGTSNDGISLDANHTLFQGVNARLPGRIIVGASSNSYPKIMYNAVPSASVSWSYAANDTAWAINMGGGNRMGFEYVAAGTAGTSFSSWNTIMVLVSGSNSVGIGTTSPAALLDVNGNTIIRGALTASIISASSNISGSTLHITGNENIGGTSTITGRLTANSGITTTTITASGAISSSAGLLGTTVTATSNVTVGGTLSVTGATTLTGALTASIISASSNISSSTLRTTGNTAVGGTLNVTGATTLVGALTASIISASSWISGSDLRVANSATVGTTLQVTGVTTLQNNLIVSGNTTLGSSSAQTVTSNVGFITSPAYVSGWAGRGWRLDYASNQTSSLDLDNLTVRGQLRVFELVINQIRATNGSLFVSSVGKVVSASFISGTDYFLTFDTASGDVGHGFARGDIIRAQRVSRAALIGSEVSQSIAGNLVYQSDLTVRNVTNLNSLTASLISGTAPSGGMDFVRLGNSESLNRQGTIYLTADDSYAPFIDVVDGVKSHSEWNNASGSGGVKVRMGKLNGITSPTFGPLTASGNNSLYGFWASGSAYLEGGINATFGNIAGWTINTSAITKSGLELNSSGTFFRAGTIVSNLTSGTGVLLSGSGDAVIGNPTGHRISFIGSNLTISASNAILKGDTVEISGSNFHLINGSITASNALLSGTITANTGAIGGWNITSTAITRSNVELNSSNNFIRLGAVTNLLTGSGIYLTGSGEALIGSASGHRISFIGGNLTISASNAVLKGNTVEISGSNFHLLNGSISASNATLSGTITANAGRIGGFTITQDAITGSGFFLSGSATGDGFFISASNFNVKANGQVTGSNVLFTGGKVGGFTLSSDAISGTGFFLSGSAGTNDFFISSSNFNVKGNGTITASAGLVGGWNITSTAITRSGAELNSSNNFIRLGTAINLLTGSGVFLSGSGEALIGSASGHRISFISNTLTISASNATLKGNTVEISSSNFHLTGGNVTMTGTITANAGRIGGFGITQDAITGSGFFLSGSATGDGFFISASNFNVKANGQVTGSNVLFIGGKIGGFTLSSDAISGAGFLLSGSATGNGFFISASNFNVKANGTITASAGLIGGFNTTSDKIESTGSFTSGSFTSPYISLKANGQITGSEVLLRRLQSDGNVYTHFDTSTGIIDARNVGRVVISDPNEYKIYTDTTTTGSGATPETMSRAVKVTQAANTSYLGGEFTYGVPSTGLPNPSVAIPGNIIPLGSNVIDNGGSAITALSTGNGWVTVNQHYVQLLQGENTFLLSFTMMGRINTAINSTYSSNNRYHDFRIVIATGSYEYVPTGGTSGNSTYNKFGGTQNLIISASTNSFYRAQAVGSNDTVRIIAPFFTGSVADTSTGYKSGVFPIPDTFQGKYVTLILQLRHWSEVNNYGNQTNGANFRRGWYGLETKIKGITLTATRQFTGRTSQGAIPLVTSSAPTFISSTG